MIMSWFSLDWFKKNKEQKSVTVDPKGQTTITPQDAKKFEYPVKSMKLINDVLTVITKYGEVLTKTGATEDDFNKVANVQDLEELKRVMTTVEGLRTLEYERQMEEKYQKEVIQAEKILTGMQLLAQLSDFRAEGNAIIMNVTDRSLPEVLINEFADVVDKYKEYSLQQMEDLLQKDEKYQSLKYFFMWACLNPRAEVANDLFGFLKKNSFRITKQGFFAALRNVVTVEAEDEEGSRELMEFITNCYNKVKAVWKKKPDEFEVFKIVTGDDRNVYELKKTGSFKAQEHIATRLGNLKDLYKEVPKMKGNRYTDAHTMTFDIRVGKVVNMPPEQCSWSTADCAEAGLHFTADEIHYVGCGDTSMLILINPMKVVGIGTHKGRCYEYLPIMTVPSSEATKLLHDVDFDTLQLDEEYAIRELETLYDRAQAGFIAETVKNEFNLPGISTDRIKKIVASLEDMREVLSKRVSSITN